MSELTPPFPMIRQGLSEGHVIPFLGSGASLCNQPDAVSRIPSAEQLTDRLAARIVFPKTETKDLPKVAQYYSVVGGPEELYRDLHGIFDHNYSPGALHRYLAKIDRPVIVVTTNYDTLIEQAFSDAGKPFDLIVHSTSSLLGERLLWWPHDVDHPSPTSARRIDVDLDKVSVIYKMHGGIDRKEPSRDQYVITEDDYIAFLTRMTKKTAIPAILAEPFQNRHFLFLGYALKDWNLRVVLNGIERDLRMNRAKSELLALQGASRSDKADQVMVDPTQSIRP